MKLPKFLDYPLRSLKYLLLGFLIYSVFVLMSVTAVQAFLDSPYNLVSDIKMFYFFADVSRFALIVLGILFIILYTSGNVATKSLNIMGIRVVVWALILFFMKKR